MSHLGSLLVTGIILAAGESTRLGQFKPLLPWPAEVDHDTLVAYQARQLLSAGADPVIVVTGARSDEVGCEARRAGATVVFNAGYEQGKSTSVRAGVLASPEGRSVLILGVDQPRAAAVLSALCTEHLEPDGILIPTYQGRRGHPPVFGPLLRQELLAINEESQGLRAVLRAGAAHIKLLDFDDRQVLLNINAADDLVMARQLFAGPRT